MTTLAQSSRCVNRTRQGIQAHQAYLATCPRYAQALADLEDYRSRIASVRACKHGLSRSSKFDRCQLHSANAILEDLERELRQVLELIKALDGRSDPSAAGLEDLDESCPF